MCLNTGTPKKIIFSFETNGKFMALDVPILKHFRVDCRLTVNSSLKSESGLSPHLPHQYFAVVSYEKKWLYMCVCINSHLRIVHLLPTTCVKMCAYFL